MAGDDTRVTIRTPGGPAVETTLGGIEKAVKVLAGERRRNARDRAEQLSAAAVAKAEPDPGFQGIAADRLRSLVERIERLEEEKQAIAGDIREVFAEAKGAGFDTKIMRQVMKLRRLEKDDLQEQEHLLDLYKRALGMA